MKPKLFFTITIAILFVSCSSLTFLKGEAKVKSFTFDIIRQDSSIIDSIYLNITGKNLLSAKGLIYDVTVMNDERPEHIETTHGYLFLKDKVFNPKGGGYYFRRTDQKMVLGFPVKCFKWKDIDKAYVQIVDGRRYYSELYTWGKVDYPEKYVIDNLDIEFEECK